MGLVVSDIEWVKERGWVREKWRKGERWEREIGFRR